MLIIKMKNNKLIIGKITRGSCYILSGESLALRDCKLIINIIDNLK